MRLTPRFYPTQRQSAFGQSSPFSPYAFFSSTCSAGRLHSYCNGSPKNSRRPKNRRKRKKNRLLAKSSRKKFIISSSAKKSVKAQNTPNPKNFVLNNAAQYVRRHKICRRNGTQHVRLREVCNRNARRNSTQKSTRPKKTRNAFRQSIPTPPNARLRRNGTPKNTRAFFRHKARKTKVPKTKPPKKPEKHRNRATKTALSLNLRTFQDFRRPPTIFQGDKKVLFRPTSRAR